jgi:hypothetical protein
MGGVVVVACGVTVVTLASGMAGEYIARKL